MAEAAERSAPTLISKARAACDAVDRCDLETAHRLANAVLFSPSAPADPEATALASWAMALVARTRGQRLAEIQALGTCAHASRQAGDEARTRAARERLRQISQA